MCESFLRGAALGSTGTFGLGKVGRLTIEYSRFRIQRLRFIARFVGVSKASVGVSAQTRHFDVSGGFNWRA